MTKFITKALVGIAAISLFSASANAQLGGFLNNVQKAVKQAQQQKAKPQPDRTDEPTSQQNDAPDTSPNIPISIAERRDIDVHSSNPAYLKRYEGRFFEAVGEGEFDDDGNLYPFENRGAQFTVICSNFVGPHPRVPTGANEKPLWTVRGELADEIVGSADSDVGSVKLYYLKNCRDARAQPQPTAKPAPPQAPTTATATQPKNSNASPLTDKEFSDLSEQSDNPKYLRKYEGRLVRVSGEISYFEGEYSIGTEEGVSYWCKSVAGKLPASGAVSVTGSMTAPYIEAGEDGSAVFLSSCRVADNQAKAPSGEPQSASLVGQKDSFCDKAFCSGTYTNGSGLNTSSARAVLAEVKDDAVQNCIQEAGYNGEEETPKLRTRCARALPDAGSRLDIEANCSTGNLHISGYGNFDQRFTFKGLNPRWRRGSQATDPQGNFYTKYLLWNVDENAWEQSSGAAHYDMGVIFFQRLCPAYVKDWRESMGDSEMIPEL